MMTSVAIVSNKVTATPLSQEERAAREFLSPQLGDKISRVVLSYLFDGYILRIDRVFGENYEPLIAQREVNFAYASSFVHTTRKKDGQRAYPNEGHRDYFPMGIKSAAQMFRNHMNSHSKERYRLLDIGGGDGQFANTFSYDRTEGYTVSASDLRSWNFGKEDKFYHICDASKILRYRPIAELLFNAIVCDTAIGYLEDNAHNISEFYELLAPGGVMYITEARFIGMREVLKEMFEELNDEGYAMVAILYPGALQGHRVSTLIIQKTHPHLNFPISYDQARPVVQLYNKKDNFACYAPDPRLMSQPDEAARQKEIDRCLDNPNDCPWGDPIIVRPKDPNHPLNKLYSSVAKK